MLQRYRLAVLGSLAAVAIFAFDLSTPLGVDAGLAYVVLVLLSLFSGRAATPYVAALVGTVLTVIGFYLSSVDVAIWEAVENRFLAVFVLWITAALCHWQQHLRSEHVRLREAKTLIEQDAAEQRLIAEKLSYFSAIVESSDDAIVSKTLEGTITSWNTGAENLYGYTAAEAIGQHISIIDLPGHSEEAADVLARLKRRERVDHLETVRRHKDGRQIHVSLTVSLIRSSNGEIVGISAIGRDITERKLAEQNLSHFLAIIESCEDAIFSTDPNGRITSWNNSAEQLYGYSARAAIGQHVTLLSPPQRRDEELELLNKALQGESSDHFDTVQKREDGALIDVSLNVSPIRDASGKIKGVSSIARDATARKEAEKELRRYAQDVEQSNRRIEQQAQELTAQTAELRIAQQTAEQANRAKSEFLANMSHEIRTPMTAILGFAELLIADTDKEQANPQHVEAANTIIRNGKYLLELINDILDLSKIESGKLEVERINCSPSQVVADVNSLMSVRAEAKGVPLEVAFEGPIPAQIQTDPTRLRQILINFVGNAIKFTEVGKVRLVTRLVQEHADQPSLRFDVIDLGIGMNSAQLSRLFTPFTQADASTTRKFGGTGLGLTISKRLAEMLDGTVTVTSSAGEGSTFSVSIPTGSLAGVQMVQASGDRLDGAKNRQAEKSSQPNQEIDCRVLLAEDGPDNQRLISFLLRKAGADVTIVANGQQALEQALAAAAGTGEQAADGPFDVILMDMQMPVLDGYSATTQLREQGYDRPIIALTAHAMSGDRQKCLDAGCNDYATKPIDRRQLIGLVAQYAGQTVSAAGDD